ncbi:transporter substrate-binding domain-containing protein [Acinetobacter sp. WZC-1]|uniref:transporter substrate-binding domain-containing protein n=1 Tax=Acinetobacter sp. WZC-1 TaxID=3459034 RepID=UPI00403D70ED
MKIRYYTAFILTAVFSAQQPWAQTSHLDDVLKNKTLKVCTTGDYKPYSFLNDQKQYEGLDIAMAQSLARSLDAKVNFIPVSWKTLMQDFQAQQCDIAMGGVSVTLKRQQTAWYSSPLGVDGKIPLVRCEDQQKYQTVAQMNRAEVRLIEPAGGTNEAYVREHLPQASLEFSDNITIFDKLLDKKADVMITDTSEALYQQKQKPGLCAVRPDQPLQYGEKAYLLPQNDMSWKMYVDQWLHLSQANGEYQQLQQQWMPR